MLYFHFAGDWAESDPIQLTNSDILTGLNYEIECSQTIHRPTNWLARRIHRVLRNTNTHHATERAIEWALCVCVRTFVCMYVFGAMPNQTNTTKSETLTFSRCAVLVFVLSLLSWLSRSNIPTLYSLPMRSLRCLFEWVQCQW